VLRARHGIALSCLCLVVLGVVFVTSASLDVARGGQTTLEELLFGRATLFAAISMGCLWVGSLVPVERLQHLRGLRNPVWWILVASVGAIVLVHVPGIGREVNGASRWIAVGPIVFQPSEIAKWGMPLVMAWWCCFRGAEGLRRFWSGFVPPVLCAGAIALGIAVEDLGTATLVMLVTLIVLVAAGCRWWHAALLMPMAALGFVALIVTSPYRVNRILAYLDPYDDARGIGYHIIQSMGAISGGGLTGRGLGNSVQKFGYLPEGTTDFIYAIICEETGLIGALLVVLLYAALLWSGWCIVGAVWGAGDGSTAAAARENRSRLTPYCQIVGLGVLATIGFQALINMLVVTGLAPTKGIALPLVSRGGTGWMLTCFSLGLLMAMDRAMQREDQRVGALSAGSVGGGSVDAPAEACGGSENAPAPAA
jgi:cell division protein FtsW